MEQLKTELTALRNQIGSMSLVFADFESEIDKMSNTVVKINKVTDEVESTKDEINREMLR